MKIFTGSVETDKIGSKVEFEFEAEDDATEKEIEALAREAMFDCIQWNYKELKQ